MVPVYSLCDAQLRYLMFKPSYGDGLGTIGVSGKTPSEFASGKDCPGYTVPWALEAKRALVVV